MEGKGAKIRAAQAARTARSHRRMLRLCVCGLIYGSLLAGTVILILGLIWIFSNTRFGLPLVTGLCLLTGCLLFFRLFREERRQKRTAARCIFPPQPVQ